MGSLVAAHGGSKTATLRFDVALDVIINADVVFSPDPGITSVSLSPNRDTALVTFSTNATPNALYTVTVAPTVASPPLTSNTLTFPLVFGSAPVVDLDVAEISAVLPQPAQTFQGQRATIDVKAITSVSEPPPQTFQGNALLAGISVAQPISYYLMRAYNTSIGGYVWWTSSGSPDFTGAQSPYPPINLTDIVLDQTLCP